MGYPTAADLQQLLRFRLIPDPEGSLRAEYCAGPADE
jgi:hypothetical protein